MPVETETVATAEKSTAAAPKTTRATVETEVAVVVATAIANPPIVADAAPHPPNHATINATAVAIRTTLTTTSPHPANTIATGPHPLTPVVTVAIVTETTRSTVIAMRNPVVTAIATTNHLDEEIVIVIVTEIETGTGTEIGSAEIAKNAIGKRTVIARGANTLSMRNQRNLKK